MKLTTLKISTIFGIFILGFCTMFLVYLVYYLGGEALETSVSEINKLIFFALFLFSLLLSIGFIKQKKWSRIIFTVVILTILFSLAFNLIDSVQQYSIEERMPDTSNDDSPFDKGFSIRRIIRLFSSLSVIFFLIFFLLLLYNQIMNKELKTIEKTTDYDDILDA